MNRKIRIAALVVMTIGIIGFAFGGTFIGLGMAKDNMLKEEMRMEKVTYQLPEEDVARGDVVDTAEEAEKVADTVREHRHGIAETYSDLMETSPDGRYDPTDPDHLSYNQAMNLENYLYLAVLGFGVTQVVIGTGVFMLIAGLGLAVTGFLIYRVSGKVAV